MSLENAEGTLNGRSACAFSGLDDDDDGFEHTQSWGQIDRETRAFLSTIGSHPGFASKPTIGGGD